MKHLKQIIFSLFLLFNYSKAENYLLIPMDKTQSNHLKAYGSTFLALNKGYTCKWLLNYKGGSFLLPNAPSILSFIIEKGIDFVYLNKNNYQKIKKIIAANNMNEIKLEKAPKIAIYTPTSENPWADAVTLAINYAEIPYDKIYDREVLIGALEKYDWLHLHHEDFTGSFNKFTATLQNEEWLQEKVATANREAQKTGFKNVSEHKKKVARTMQLAVSKGLFLFAMCASSETLDIALAAEGVDIIDATIDTTPIDKEWKSKIDYQKTFAFENFEIYVDPYRRSFSDIDYNQVNTVNRKETSDFILFEFSAKIDPIETLLTQNHQNRIKGFFGQTTSFNPSKIKDGVRILAKTINQTAKYITGNYGKGTFTFYGGHAPEDKNHFIGDQKPDMKKNKNSAGYRIILNNILYPSAKPPRKKT